MAKLTIKEMINLAKKNAKNGPAKNKIWALVCCLTAVALFIWWICILASF